MPNVATFKNISMLNSLGLRLTTIRVKISHDVVYNGTLLTIKYHNLLVTCSYFHCYAITYSVEIFYIISILWWHFGSNAFKFISSLEENHSNIICKFIIWHNICCFLLTTKKKGYDFCTSMNVVM